LDVSGGVGATLLASGLGDAGAGAVMAASGAGGGVVGVLGAGAAISGGVAAGLVAAGGVTAGLAASGGVAEAGGVACCATAALPTIKDAAIRKVAFTDDLLGFRANSLGPIPRPFGEASAEPTARIAESSAAGMVNRDDVPCAPRRAGRTCL
jgi:hypothetical protein